MKGMYEEGRVDLSLSFAIVNKYFQTNISQKAIFI